MCSNDAHGGGVIKGNLERVILCYLAPTSRTHVSPGKKGLQWANNLKAKIIKQDSDRPARLGFTPLEKKKDNAPSLSR